MWAIRILSGPQAGQILSLKPGRNKLGRSAQAEIQLQGPGISKEHLEIQVFPDRIVLLDLKSSNGSYLNGIRIQNAIVRMGDKMSAHNILFEIVAAPDSSTQLAVHQTQATVNYQHTSIASHSPEPAIVPEAVMSSSWKTKLENYRDNVVLSGLVQMTEVFEFRSIVMGFAAAFILLVTLLSVVPMKQITSESVQLESRRRAQTVARALAQANEKVIRMGDLSNFSTDFVLREDGIDDVYIVSKDGSILAPPERAGTRPKDTAFTKKVLGQMREVADELDSGRVAAAYPIVSFNPDLQQNVAKAYAVVVFNTGSLQFDDGRALSLFIQMLVIASLLGAILFYFLFKLIEHPWKRLSEEIDQALRENRDQVQFPLKFDSVQNLMVTVNSLLVRATSAQNVQNAPSQSSNFRDLEMRNLCEIIGYPAVVINRAGLIVSMNSQFEALISVNAHQLLGEGFQQIPDQALQKNIESLMSVVRQSPNQTQTDHFEISGHPLNIHCVGVASPQGEADYFVISLTPQSQTQGGAA